MSFICMRIRNHFHINSFAFDLALKQRFGLARKWPIFLRIFFCRFLRIDSFKIYQTKQNCIRKTSSLVISCHSRVVTAKKSKCTEKQNARAEFFVLILCGYFLDVRVVVVPARHLLLSLAQTTSTRKGLKAYQRNHRYQNNAGRSAHL